MNPTYATAQKRLEAYYDPGESKATLQLLVEDLLGLNWSRVAMGLQPLADEDATKLVDAVERIIAGEPPQHLTGIAWFYGRAFQVDNRVLIPRPETEELVAWVLSKMKDQAWRILDIGTGSGCIPISLALEAPEAQLAAIDLSKEALQVASQNAEKLEAKVSFSQHDILNFQPTAFTQLDCIVSNPPYVPQGEFGEMSARVRDHEPRMALFVPDEDPLRFYEALAKAGNVWLKPGGHLFCEIHADYGKETVALFENQGYKEVFLQKDMQQRDRMVHAVRDMR
ncbi:MAG: peptide chain release factor N(5)-glutamine methyltransferase [Bacteroidia bacterium]